MADSLYVSYAWKAEEQKGLVDRLEAACRKRDITLKRDRNEISYGKSIRAFMDEIGQGDHVALILSEPYFKSEYCMYELKAIH
ncbi:MAG: toll/interleukin-1 receptor domain-containing protein, partial [Rhodocyclaceae bacterium]